MEEPGVLGIDIGGSHITAALIDLKMRTIVPHSYKRQLVDSQDDANRILNNWTVVIKEVFKDANVANQKIGIAMPGPFDYVNGISLIQEQDKFKTLYGLNLKEELSSRLNMNAENIRFINDAAGFLQGEVFCGAARGFKRVLGLTLGTGLGSALSIDGIAEDADLWDSEFKEGIAEDYLSTRWFVKRFKELSGINVKGVKELIEINEADVYIKQIFSEFANNLSKFLIPLVQAHALEVVVIGGNISQVSHLFFPELTEILKENKIVLDVKKAVLREDASLIGAASCWEEI